jgi:hypothetical protein
MSLVAVLTAIGALPAQAAYLDVDSAQAILAAQSSPAGQAGPTKDAAAATRLAAGPAQSVTVTYEAPIAVQVDTFTAEEIPPPVPMAVADGVVSSVTAFDDGGLGVHVMVDHVVAGQRVTSTYGHMLAGSAAVTAGQSVIAGQLLGAVGSTGQSTGAHLHLEIHLDGVTAIDPYGWLTQHAGPM